MQGLLGHLLMRWQKILCKWSMREKCQRGIRLEKLIYKISKDSKLFKEASKILLLIREKDS